MSKTDEKLDKLIEAVNKIAQPIPAIPPIPSIAPITPLYTGDHDTLTGLVVSMANLDKKVDAISDKLDTRYTTIDEHKIVVGIQTDHEARIRTNEKDITQIRTWGAGFLLLLGLAETIAVKFFLK